MSISKFNKNFATWLRSAPKHLPREELREAFIAHRVRQSRAKAAGARRGSQRAAVKRSGIALRSRMRMKGPKLPRGQRRRRLSRPDILLYRYPPDVLRDVLVPDFAQRWIPMRRRLQTRGIKSIRLEHFSFKTNPNGTLSQLIQLIKACATAAEIRLHFVDQHCDDVAPYILLAHLRRHLPPIVSGGLISREVYEVVDAVGLKRALRIGRTSGDLPAETQVSAFQMFSRVPPGAFGDQEHQLRPQYKEIIADHFCDTLNGWLDQHNLQLTPDAEAKIVASFGEALDNAERHGNLSGDPGTGDWSVAGFSRLIEKPDGEQILECSVAIVGVGTTISESLATAEEGIRRRIDAYAGQHSTIFGTAEDRENLRTVMALQDGITRVKAASLGWRGGVGLMQLVNTFGELGDCDREGCQSVVTLLSGRSCLRITHPYRMGVASSGGMLRELWFNESNSDTEPPDREHVFTVRQFFPGTILSACFTIDPSYLRRQLVNADDGRDKH